MREEWGEGRTGEEGGVGGSGERGGIGAVDLRLVGVLECSLKLGGRKK